MHASRMGRAEWVMLITLSVLWGGSFFFNAIAVRELPTLTIVALRVGVAALALWAWLLATGQSVPRDPSLWRAFIGMGLLNNIIPFGLIVWAQGRIPGGLASILNATTPLFTVLLAHLLTADERLTPDKLIGVVIGLVGATVVVGPDVLATLGWDLWAQLACLGAAVSYACASLYGRRFRAMGVSTVATAAGQVTASTLVLLPVALVVEQPWTGAALGAETWAAVIGIGLLSTAAAYVLFFRILAASGAVNLMLVTFLIPVSAILLGSAVLGEALLLRHFAGMALIAVGLACIDGRLLPRQAASSSTS